MPFACLTIALNVFCDKLYRLSGFKASYGLYLRFVVLTC